NLKNFTHNFTFVGTKKAPVELPLVVVAILLAILTMWLILEAVPLFVRASKSKGREKDMQVFPNQD
ncbi:MAG: small neutral amino acid transporter SnatA (MarC family), partial [Planctomycetota bacterium]